MSFLRSSHARRVGVALLVLSATAFAILALLAAFREPLLLAIDRPVQREVIEHRSPWLTEVMRWVSLLGTRYVIGALLLVVAAWTFRTGRCRIALLVLVVAFAVNPIVEFAFKELVARPRPGLALLGRARGPSFPSGHVIAAAGFYGMLPTIVGESPRRRGAQLVTGLLAAALIGTIGFSRIYLGVHWLTDVIGGFLLGVTVVGATYAALRGHRLDPVRCAGGRGQASGADPTLHTVAIGGDRALGQP